MYGCPASSGTRKVGEYFLNMVTDSGSVEMSEFEMFLITSSIRPALI